MVSRSPLAISAPRVTGKAAVRRRERARFPHWYTDKNWSEAHRSSMAPVRRERASRWVTFVCPWRAHYLCQIPHTTSRSKKPRFTFQLSLVRSVSNVWNGRWTYQNQLASVPAIYPSHVVRCSRWEDPSILVEVHAILDFSFCAYLPCPRFLYWLLKGNTRRLPRQPLL